uniref:Alpha-1,3-mannosyl-glycoprotein 4-beta-N-acetylglucosaminyltransferase-like protein MGAT4E n=1 Tax=Catagonus wagneri TaxID=51154 RepID=A0A8C3YFM1_9CETA
PKELLFPERLNRVPQILAQKTPGGVPTVAQQVKDPAWLTVGVSSGSWLDRSSLLSTLLSLFRATSKAEQQHLTVLVHLADPDPTELRETVFQISSLFSPQLLAGRLLLIHAPPDAYPKAEGIRGLARAPDLFSRQNVDHAYLVSFAAGLSEYFLLLDDNAFCAPSFVSHIQWKVDTAKSDPWVLLEFSNLGFLGKLLRDRDLPALAHFLLLFYREKPLDRLIPHFRTLRAQKDPVLCRPLLFYQRSSHQVSSASRQASTAQRKGPGGPHNPPGAVFTDMKVFDAHFPWEAYTLDESFFWTHRVRAGNHLTVILNQPANLRRVRVLTGTVVDGTHVLEKGQVELGYQPEGVPQRCASFAVLGRLWEGQLDQEVLPRSTGYDVSCVRLVVNADQAGGLIIRHIYLWEERAGDVEVAWDKDNSLIVKH